MKINQIKILVTGAGGFIGSHLTEELVKQGAKVKAFVKYNSHNSWGWLENSEVLKDVEIHLGNIRDYDSVKKAVKSVDVIFHLAALIAIPYSYISPLAYIRTNVEGTYNILQAAKEFQVGKIIHTSTSEVYGTAKYVPIDEKHPLQPQSPYSASKIAADNLALSFYYSFKLPVAIIRPFNTYGPRQSARAVIPTIISQIASGKTCIELGATHPTRDFNYIKDTVAAFIALAEVKNSIGEIVNAGSNYEISIGETATLIADVMGISIELKKDQQRLRPEKSEVDRLWADNSKIKELTNWTPSYAGWEGFRKGISETVNWISNPENLKLYKNIYNY